VTPTSGHSRHAQRWIVAVAVAVVAVILAVAVVDSLSTDELIVVVPAGTGERIDAGEAIELLPRTLDVSVGDRLEIRNLDDRVHEVGPYTVAAGQTLRQAFTSPGVLEGACTLHPSGAITIRVR
jgi:plastocyanin